VLVTLVDQTKVEGILVDVDGRSITVSVGERSRTVAARDVLRVQYSGGRSRHIIKGMLVGAAAGAALMVVIDRQSSHPSSVAEAAGLGAIAIGLPIGAATGALMPAGQPLYEVPTSIPVREGRQ
jgi:hypothetical protein